MAVSTICRFGGSVLSAMNTALLNRLRSSVSSVASYVEGSSRISVSSPISLFDLLSMSDSMSSARCCDTRTVNIAITASQNARNPAPIRVKKLQKVLRFLLSSPSTSSL